MGRDPGLLDFESVLKAVGRDGDMGTTHCEVPLDSILGSVGRTEDFDSRFRPRRRTDRLASLREHMDRAVDIPRVRLFRLGDLYFVVDGHHRIAIARERNWVSIPSVVQRVCTVAYARRCLTVASLPVKEAERRFLERLPLPDDVVKANWLDRAADWSRLADAARSWGLQRQLDDGTTYESAGDLASAWWFEEVLPIVTAWRSASDDAVDLPDL